MEEVKIHDNIVTTCPKYGFALRQVKHCLSCEFYHGMKRATVNGEPIPGDDHNAFQVICAGPMSRRMQEIVMD